MTRTTGTTVFELFTHKNQQVLFLVTHEIQTAWDMLVTHEIQLVSYVSQPLNSGIILQVTYEILTKYVILVTHDI